MQKYTQYCISKNINDKKYIKNGWMDGYFLSALILVLLDYKYDETEGI